MELVNAVRLVGLSNVLKLGRAYRLGWNEMIRGSFATRTMHALLNVGLIDEFQAQGWVDLEAFARAKNLDASVLTPLCDALYSIRILKKDGTKYGLDSKGVLLVEEMRGWFEVSYGYDEIFSSLEPMLRGQKVYGKDFYRRSDYVATGSGAMGESLFFPLANQIMKQKGYKRVLDLGCGDGTFLLKLCEMDPEVSCLGIDIAPEAVEEGKQKIQQAGLQNRIQLFAEDISKIQELPEPLRKVDAATIFFILHELLDTGDDRVIDFLQSFRKVFPGVPLIVFEVIRPTAEELRRRPGITIYYKLYHALSHQRLADNEKWKSLFKKAGFDSVEERHLGFARTAIYTLRSTG
jgi:cyclopropane fatty-acyl-phospholipid synthase-like methyltransferase